MRLSVGASGSSTVALAHVIIESIEVDQLMRDLDSVGMVELYDSIGAVKEAFNFGFFSNFSNHIDYVARRRDNKWD